MPKLCNAAMQALIDLLRHSHVDTDALDEAYNLSGDGSILREAMTAEVVEGRRQQRYSRTETVRLGANPGFFTAFLGAVGDGRHPTCQSCRNELKCHASGKQDISSYLIAE